MSTASLDVVAWAGGDGTLSRFDLEAFSTGSSCNVRGLVVPAS